MFGEGSVKEMDAVQRETLDHLYEGIAVFGSDGKIKLHNPIFLRFWDLGNKITSSDLHLSDVIEMIKDTIDSGDLESAKDYIGQLGDYLKVRDQNVLQMIATGNKILDKLEKNEGLTDSKNDVMLVTGLYDKKKIN